MKLIKAHTLVVLVPSNPWLTAIDIAQAAIGMMALMTASALAAIVLVT